MTVPAFGEIDGDTLIDVVRGSVVESRHRASVVALDSLERRILATGDHTGLVLARSTLKPIQLTAMVEAGLLLHRALPGHRLRRPTVRPGLGIRPRRGRVADCRGSAR